MLSKENSEFKDIVIKIMHSILTEHTELIPITKYFAEIFYETVKTFTADNFTESNMEQVTNILKISYVNNAQNLDLMKELVPLIGLMFKKFSAKILDDKLIEMLEVYSNPEKAEEMRYATSRALKHVFSDKNVVLNLETKYFLKLYMVLIRLVTDENNFIRNKACHIIYANKEAIHNDNFGVEFLMDEFVKGIIHQRQNINGNEAKIKDFEKMVGDFIFDLAFVKENTKIKYLHMYDNRIFS